MRSSLRVLVTTTAATTTTTASSSSSASLLASAEAAAEITTEFGSGNFQSHRLRRRSQQDHGASRSGSGGGGADGRSGSRPRTPYTSATPHHQSYAFSGAVGATRLMRRNRQYISGTYAVRATSEVGPAVASRTEIAETLYREKTTMRTREGGGASSFKAGTSTVALAALSGTARYVKDRTRVAGGDGAVSGCAMRAAEFDSFQRLLDRYVERGFADTAALLGHPDAPAPAIVLLRVLDHRIPCQQLTTRVLRSIVQGSSSNNSLHSSREFSSSLSTPHDTSSDPPPSSSLATQVAPLPHVATLYSSADAAYALQTVAQLLRTRSVLAVLYEVPTVRTLLIEALLHEGLFADAMEAFVGVPDSWITADLWSALVSAASQSRLPDSQLLWRLLCVSQTPHEAVWTRMGESSLLATTSGQSVTEQGQTDAEQHQQQPLGWFDARLSTVVASSFEYNAENARARNTRGADEIKRISASPPAEGEASTELEAVAPQDGVETGQDGAGRAPMTHFCKLNTCEIGYALEHYSPGAIMSGRQASVAVMGDDRGFCSHVRLYRSADQYMTDREAMVAQLSSSSYSAFAKTSKSPMLQLSLRQIENAAVSVTMCAHGVSFGLDAKTAAQLLLRAGVSFGSLASPLLALHVLRRYVRTCHLLSDEVTALQGKVHLELVKLQSWRRTLERQQGEYQRHAQQQQQQSSGNASAEAAAAAAAVQATSELVAAGERQLVLLRERRAAAVTAAAPHPSPFLIFFKILREARDVVTHSDNEVRSAGSQGAASGSTTGSGTAVSLVFTADGQPLSLRSSALPMVHWELCWHYFQVLNRENPLWYTQIPEEAGELCFNVIEVLCRGADPWLCLNVARSASARHIVDGLEISLWLLHRLDPSHHTEEARAVTQKVFRWLLVDVGVHLQSRLHHHLIAAARVLIRLGLQDDLKMLYNAVLDSVYTFSESFRKEFMTVMADLVCPSCRSLLPDQDVYSDRSCPNCMYSVPAKDPGSTPSFELSAAHIEQIRQRRRAQRQKARRRVSDNVARLSYGTGSASSSRNRPPLDAATRLKNALLRDTKPLLPGVSVSAEMALFSIEGDADEGTAEATGMTRTSSSSNNLRGSAMPLDVRAAMEESTRRLQLQDEARRYALAQRGVADAFERHGDSGLTAQASLPSAVSATTSLNGFLSPLVSGANPVRDGVSGAPAPHTSTEGGWTCVWCQEQNSEWSSRVQCSACGAETGPAAPWRSFAYAEDGEAMTEIRARIANCEERPLDAVVAAYLLMVYRRAFLLCAAPHDHERVLHLIEKLCQLQERVLAAYVYTRLVPAPSRRKDRLLLTLAQMFGGVEGYHALSSAQLTDDDVLFQTIFTPNTCKVCFGAHDWKICPIITRDFSSHRAAINMSPQEKQKAILEHVRTAVQNALQHGGENAKFVVDAYAAFVTSPFRELFAEIYPTETNQLSLLLCEFRQFRRAAFVLCHIPLHARWNEAYVKIVPYFNVTAEEAMSLLGKRSSNDVQDGTHPNFVQVTLTCCICLDEPHASFACPRLGKWLREVENLATTTTATSGNTRDSSARALMDVERNAETLRRLKAQVDGWTTAGPERLQTFYRFLLDHVDILRSPAEELIAPSFPSSFSNIQQQRRTMDLSDPLVYAVNRTISKLAAVGSRSYAYRLYAHSPPQCVSVATTVSLLRLNRFTDDGIRALLNENTSVSADDDPLSSTAAVTLARTTQASTAARTAAVPLSRLCYICAQPGHAFTECPELAAQATLADKLLYVVQQVGGICYSKEGIGAAANYVYYVYNRGQLHQSMLYDHPPLVRALLTLVRRCFATRQVASGVRVLRRLPIGMVKPDDVYVDFWRAAGFGEEVVETRRAELLALYDAEGIRPSVEQPLPRTTLSARFMSGLSHALHDDLCRHCYAHDHTLSSCGVFHAEVSFGRDYVAAYRMSMMSEQLTREWQDAYLLKLVDFFRAHVMYVPYHIAGVANALNAIAAMWCFRGEPGIALKHLLTIPPAYRRRQAFRHILHALKIPSAEINKVLDGFYFPPTDQQQQQQQQQQQSSGGGSTAIAAQHLMMPRPAIKDVAVKAVFGQFPVAMAALEQADQRMANIRSRNHADSGGRSSSLSSPSPFSANTRVSRAAVDNNVTAESGALLTNESAFSSTTTAARSGSGVSLSSSSSAASPYRVMQGGDVTQLRENFDPILTELEDAVGMKLGSRHILFTSAVDVISSIANEAANTTEAADGKSQQQQQQQEQQSTDPSSSRTATLTEAAPVEKGNSVQEAKVVAKATLATEAASATSSPVATIRTTTTASTLNSTSSDDGDSRRSLTAPAARSRTSTTPPSQQQQQQQQQQPQTSQGNRRGGSNNRGTTDHSRSRVNGYQRRGNSNNSPREANHHKSNNWDSQRSGSSGSRGGRPQQRQQQMNRGHYQNDTGGDNYNRGPRN